MADRITANLPSCNFAATEAFYNRLGFRTNFRDDGWMILQRVGLVLEYFPHPEVDKWSSWFSACIRVDDVATLLEDWQQVGLPTDPKSIPRLTGIFKPGNAPRMFALVDEDGSLLRVIDNRDAGEAA